MSSALLISDVVFEGKSLDSSLNYRLGNLTDRDKSLASALCRGVLRYQPRLQFWEQQLLSKPIKDKEAHVRALLWLGLYQLTDTGIKQHAAIHATVEAAKALNKKWATGLLNAVLRNFLRQQPSLLQACEDDEAAKYAHPTWWLKQLRADYPEHWQHIAEANNQQAPMSLRVNCREAERDNWLSGATERGVDAQPGQLADHAVQLTKPMDVHQIPGFDEGCVSVQDEAAQLCALWLNPQDGETGLDACAAPGGKTGQLLELAEHHLIALDIDGQRLMRVAENLERLELSAELIEGDISQPKAWWQGQLFDYILLDVPCTASGVIRRHPDIKLLRQPADIDNLVAVQRQCLEQAWAMLKPGGRLMYSTCSVFHAENSDQITDFLAQNDDATAQPLQQRLTATQQAELVKTEQGLQLLPGQFGNDGFFLALLQKQA